MIWIQYIFCIVFSASYLLQRRLVLLILRLVFYISNCDIKMLLNVAANSLGVMRYIKGIDIHDVMLYSLKDFVPSRYQVLTTGGLWDVS